MELIRYEQVKLNDRISTDQFLRRWGNKLDVLLATTSPAVLILLPAVLAREDVALTSKLVIELKQAILAAGVAGMTNAEIRNVFDLPRKPQET